MPIRTEKLPMTADLNQKLFDSCPLERTYVVQFNIVARILKELNKDSTGEKVEHVSIRDIPAQRLIDLLRNIEETDFQRNALVIMIKLATLEQCGNLTAHEDFSQLSSYIKNRNDDFHRLKKIEDLNVISWEEIMRISRECMYRFKPDRVSTNDSKRYTDLNKLILTTMITTMTILRTEEYTNMLLDRDPNNVCNYIYRDKDLDKWELVIDVQKSPKHFKRRIPIHKLVVDLLIEFDSKLRRRVYNPPPRKGAVKAPIENLSHLYLFKSSVGNVPNGDTLREIVKELYDPKITIMHLRAISATYFKNQPGVTVEMREKLAREMGHQFSTHVREYERIQEPSI